MASSQRNKLYRFILLDWSDDDECKLQISKFDFFHELHSFNWLTYDQVQEVFEFLKPPGISVEANNRSFDNDGVKLAELLERFNGMFFNKEQLRKKILFVLIFWDRPHF